MNIHPCSHLNNVTIIKMTYLAIMETTWQKEILLCHVSMLVLAIHSNCLR